MVMFNGCVRPFNSACKHYTHGSAEAYGRVITIADSAVNKILDEVQFRPDHGAWWTLLRDLWAKLWDLLMGTWMSDWNFIAIRAWVVDVSRENTNVNRHLGLSPENHENIFVPILWVDVELFYWILFSAPKKRWSNWCACYPLLKQ